MDRVYKALTTGSLSQKTILEKCNAVSESVLDGIDTMRLEKAIVPTEANFQLPNLFLRTKVSDDCLRYFTEHAEPMNEAAVERWNEGIQEHLSVLEEAQVEFLDDGVREGPPKTDAADLEKTLHGFICE